ncbi:MAG: dTMP kinase [Clostridiales bacterium]|jgi:dTMP kinase|nr:dTMP kinase [Clostridiales bacterium]
MRKKGKFIVFEGIDGSGKTTQSFSLVKRLRKEGIRCKGEREPSDGIIGLIARGAIRKKIEFRPESLAHLFAADRLEHVVNDIIPELENGTSVVCDRFIHSSLAFQGAFMPMETVLEYNSHTAELITPDLTLFIDVPPRVCADRKENERSGADLYENVGALTAARDNFNKAFVMLPRNVRIIDGDANEQEVFARIWEEVIRLFV